MVQLLLARSGRRIARRRRRSAVGDLVEARAGNALWRLVQRTNAEAARAVFQQLADTFGGSTASDIDLIAVDVSGSLAYTVHREITSTIIDDTPSDYVLRVTQVYRLEDGDWKVVHRHGDTDPEGSELFGTTR